MSREECSARRLPLRVRLLPIFFFLTYLNCTVFLFAYGPWPWPVEDGTKLYTFLTFAHLALSLGYLSSAAHAPRGYHGGWKIEHLLATSLIVNLLLLIPTSVFRTGNAIPDVAAGLADPASVYYASNTWRAEGGAPVEYVRIVLGPLLFLLLPLTVYYWHRLNWVSRVLAVLVILGFAATYVATGTNQGVADLVLLIPWLILARYFAGFARFDLRRIVIAIVFSAAAFLMLLSFFTAGQISRIGDRAGVSFFPLTNTSANPDNFLIRGWREDTKAGAIALAKYLTQGYYALYLSLEEPFVPMFGIGNSMFLLQNVADLTGIQEIREMSYPTRIEQGYWHAEGHWSTIYPWIASDVSFPGTLLVMFLIGRLFAFSWMDTLKGSNPFAVAVFAQFVFMLFYFPANNRVFRAGEAFTSFYGVLALWLFTRRKYVWKT